MKIMTNLAIIVLMLADIVILLRHNDLPKTQGLNLLLNGYVIGICTVLIFNTFKTKEKK